MPKENQRKHRNFATLHFMKKTLYDLLGVAPDAGADEIVLAYDKARAALEQSAQPDPNQAVILREAFQVLSHKQKRNAYDAGLAAKEAAAVQVVAEAPSNRAMWIGAAALVLAVLGWVAVKKTAHNDAQPPVAASKPPVITIQPARLEARQLNAEELYARVSPSVARVNVTDEQGNLLGVGSAVVVGPGDVITNCHVARIGPNLELNFRSEKAKATVVTADEIYDLCLLHANGLSAPPVVTADLNEVRTGEAVYAIGSPQGLELTISEGIISSLRSVPDVGTVIQTSAAISPGSSGGGLFDNQGRLIGITTFQSKSGQNLNFAVPAEWIKSMSTRSGGGMGNITMGR
ncbi:MAG: trypsin-like peptidase domain-containing protein [Burkholderiaceae bacterium]|nr:trypsin-like peptidase domain-containing protein [Burkholderiaceae bacterium]